MEGLSDIFYNVNTLYTQTTLLSGQTPVGRVAADKTVFSRQDYLRTYADGVCSNILLALPRK